MDELPDLNPLDFDCFSRNEFSGLTQEIKNMNGNLNLSQVYIDAINEQLQFQDNDEEDFELNGFDEDFNPISEPYPKSVSWNMYLDTIKTGRTYDRVLQEFYDWAFERRFPRDGNNYIENGPQVLLEYLTEKKTTKTYLGA